MPGIALLLMPFMAQTIRISTMPTENKMEKEIEVKFDVPIDRPLKDLWEECSGIVLSNRFNLVSSKDVTRRFDYFDTPDLEIYRKGETLRKISGFDPNEDRAVFRYDFKIGPIEDRYEVKHWTNRKFSIEKILDSFGLRKFYQHISTSASANTSHWKRQFALGSNLVEASLDIFNVAQGARFCELELELEQGDPDQLRRIADLVCDQLSLQTVNIQKYARVVESMPKYFGLIG
ncbi:hypothetical protein CL619_05325 [archaeon]|nr:hypothetical protein [archaeon]